MRSFGSYISKYLVSFAALILILLFLNAVVFGLTFQKIVTEDYGDSSPQSMLEMTVAAATPEQLSDDAVQKLRQNHIWAIYLDEDGQCYWSVDLPDEVPKSYTIQDVALFSKGYIEDYPVFVWNTDDGLLILGYPKDSYTKLTSNYYSISALRRLPVFVLGMLVKVEWIENFLKLDPVKLQKVQDWIKGKGSWMGFFVFLPGIGDFIAVALGFLRANIWVVAISMFLGKAIRYWVWMEFVYKVQGMF